MKSLDKIFIQQISKGCCYNTGCRHPFFFQTDPGKLKVIKEFPIPKDLRQLRGFITLASYYRKFVKNFFKITTPLNKLLKKNIRYIWTKEQ